MYFSWIKKTFSSLKKTLWSNRNIGQAGQENEIDHLDELQVKSLSASRLPTWKQLKYLPRFFNKKEAAQAKTLFVITLSMIFLFSLSWFWRHTESLPRAGGVYTEAAIGSPQYINPVYATTNDVDQDLVRLVYSGLLNYDTNLNLTPDLAESYQVSQDGKTYTFTLKPGLKWHDGQELTAADVAFTFQLIQDPANNSPLEPSLRGVKITQIDDKTVQFVLPRTFAPFLHILSTGILPQHIWQKISPQNFKLAELNLKPIGSGPWEFSSLKKNKDGNLISYSLTPFQDYYGQQPLLEKFNFKFYPSIEIALQALLDKNVDGLSFLPKEKKYIVHQQKGVTIQELQLPQYTAIFINADNNPVLTDTKIRQALSLAIDKNELVENILQGEAKPINSPLLPGLFGYDSDSANTYNPEEANRLLTEAGWEKPEGSNLRTKDEQTLSFILTVVNFEDNIKIAEYIKNYFEQIGVELQINIVPSSTIQQDIIKPRNYQLLMFGEILGSDPDLFPFWHSSQKNDPGLNLTSFNNKKADALLEQARQTLDEEKRIELYKEFESILGQNSPAIFLYQPTYSYVLSEKIKGYSLKRINIPTDRLIGNESWYIKTKRSWKKN